MTELVLYNTLTRRKERFEPLVPGEARVYTCGPTVYSPQHIGNLRPVLFADLLVRALLAEGLAVHHVINVTDVGHLTDDEHDSGDDKMELAARRSGRRAEEIAAEYTEQWLRDRRRLNCLEPEVLCKATDHIPEQIEMIRLLEAKGVTYAIADGLYFDTTKFPRYAEFARLDREELRAGERIGEVEGKRHPADFALWKFAQPGVRRQQEWDSPWGRGFPGWHIECSAMAHRYLGSPFDIHTGGVEHVKVHHTNEIAQSETALRRPPLGRASGSTRTGSSSRARRSRSPSATPSCSTTSWTGAGCRSPSATSSSRRTTASSRTFTTRRWRRRTGATAGCSSRRSRCARRRGSPTRARLAPWRKRFCEAVRDDLNAPRALAVAGEAARDEGLAPADRRALLEEFDALARARSADGGGHQRAVRERPAHRRPGGGAAGCARAPRLRRGRPPARRSRGRGDRGRRHAGGAEVAEEVSGRFELVSEFEPQGDQPRAIEELVRGIARRRPAPDAARGHRLGQVLHDGLRGRRR